MRLHSLALFLLLGIPFIQSGDQHEDYSVRDVDEAITEHKHGYSLGFADKHVDRLGDRVSIALLKLYNEAQLKDSQTVRGFLPVVLEAFKYPQLIDIPADKEPRVTNYLLEHLEREVSDPVLKKEISNVRKTIQDLTAKTVVKPSGAP
jgi:hypothetical protein